MGFYQGKSNPAELAANDFGKRSAGSGDASHVVRQSTKTLSPATLSLASLSDVRDWFLMHSKMVVQRPWHFSQEEISFLMA